MPKNFKLPGRHEIIEKTLNSITSRKRVHSIFYFLILALYIIAIHYVKKTAGNQDPWMINNIPIPMASFTGVFFALTNICLIYAPIKIMG